MAASRHQYARSNTVQLPREFRQRKGQNRPVPLSLLQIVVKSPEERNETHQKKKRKGKQQQNRKKKFSQIVCTRDQISPPPPLSKKCIILQILRSPLLRPFPPSVLPTFVLLSPFISRLQQDNDAPNEWFIYSGVVGAHLVVCSPITLYSVFIAFLSSILKMTLFRTGLLATFTRFYEDHVLGQGPTLSLHWGQVFRVTPLLSHPKQNSDLRERVHFAYLWVFAPQFQQPAIARGALLLFW